jgi:hypothetical protein
VLSVFRKAFRSIGLDVLAVVGDDGKGLVVELTGGSQYDCLRTIDATRVDGNANVSAPFALGKVVPLERPSKRLISSSPQESDSNGVGAREVGRAGAREESSSALTRSNIERLAGVTIRGLSLRVIETVKHSNGSGTRVLKKTVKS